MYNVCDMTFINGVYDKITTNVDVVVVDVNLLNTYVEVIYEN